MSETEMWDDACREDLRETLRSVVLGEVRLGKHDADDILEICREAYIEDECPEDEWGAFVAFAERELEGAVSRLESERASWPDETDCDRLDQAEATLRDRGILLWQVSPCCDTCSGAELPDRIEEIDRRQPGFRDRVRGYAFFIDQNMPEALAESTQLSVYLAYGWFSPDDGVASAVYEDKALGVGREVCECLSAHGLTVRWDGDFSRKIGVSLNWQRRARPAS